MSAIAWSFKRGMDSAFDRKESEKEKCYLASLQTRTISHNRGRDFIPVEESWNGRRRRMTCYGCRRSANNRGACIHKSISMKSANYLDGDNDAAENVTTPPVPVGRRRERLNSSMLPRRPIPCDFEIQSTQRIISSISYCQAERVKAGYIDEHGNGLNLEERVDIFGFDHQRTCQCCGYQFFFTTSAHNAKTMNER